VKADATETIKLGGHLGMDTKFLTKEWTFLIIAIKKLKKSLPKHSILTKILKTQTKRA
jgi:hypothetical protein